jgi:glutaredoxin
MSPAVRLIGASGCHLCDAAERVLEQVRAERPFELERVDISGDAELELRYRERIPVVEIDGREAFHYFVHPDALRRRLEQAEATLPPRL